MLVSEVAGTTRDSVQIPLYRAGRAHVLVDTAGIRRRGQVAEVVEKFSVIKALRAIQTADVVVLLIDAQEGIAEQDLRLLGYALEAGRAIVIGVNKWDGLPAEQRVRVRRELERRLVFAEFLPIHYLSALHGSGVGELFRTVLSVYAAATHRPPTARINSVLQEATAAHAPPLVGGRRIKLRYAHLGGLNPPRVVVHGNQTESIPESYRSYLAGAFRRAFGWQGTPVQVEFKTGENPFKGRRNTLTPRQLKHRARVRRYPGRR
jgi:GTP-binding protein